MPCAASTAASVPTAPLPCIRACQKLAKSVLGPAIVATALVSGCASRSRGAPFTRAWNVITGVWPGPVLVIDWIVSATWGAVGLSKPTRCLSATPASPPDAGWHTAHAMLSGCGPPPCSTIPVGTGCTNAVVSWHDVHASLLGAAFQRSAWAPAWHAVHPWISRGNTTDEKSFTLWPKPMIRYGVPATTVGRL